MHMQPLQGNDWARQEQGWVGYGVYVELEARRSGSMTEMQWTIYLGEGQGRKRGALQG